MYGITLKREAVRRQLQELIPTGAETWCETEFRFAVGDPAAEILRCAQETQANLIVMGAEARTALAGHLPGTTAYKVVSIAHCLPLPGSHRAHAGRASAGRSTRGAAAG